MSPNASFDVVEGIEYTTTEDGPLLLDLYRPRSAAPSPVTLYVHGGAWLMRDRVTHVAPFGEGLAARGVAVASIDYRLGPAGVFPRSVRDVKAAVRWLRGNGGSHGLATERIGSWGPSAGGHLSLMAALTPEQDDGSDRIDAVVDCYGPTDLPATLTRTDLERQILRPPPTVAYLGSTHDDPAPELARAASPLFQDLAAAPPILIVHGDRDQQMALDQSVRLQHALVSAGRDVQLIVLGGAGHEDPKFEQPWVLDSTAAFLFQHLLP